MFFSGLLIKKCGQDLNNLVDAGKCEAGTEKLSLTEIAATRKANFMSARGAGQAYNGLTGVGNNPVRQLSSTHSSDNSEIRELVEVQEEFRAADSVLEKECAEELEMDLEEAGVSARQLASAGPVKPMDLMQDNAAEQGGKRINCLVDNMQSEKFVNKNCRVATIRHGTTQVLNPFKYRAGFHDKCRDWLSKCPKGKMMEWQLTLAEREAETQRVNKMVYGEKSTFMQGAKSGLAAAAGKNAGPNTAAGFQAASKAGGARRELADDLSLEDISVDMMEEFLAEEEAAEVRSLQYGSATSAMGMKSANSGSRSNSNSVKNRLSPLGGLWARQAVQEALNCLVNYPETVGMAKASGFAGSSCDNDVEKLITLSSSDIRLHPNLQRKCSNELKQFCDHLDPGNSRVLTCLR